MVIGLPRHGHGIALLLTAEGGIDFEVFISSNDDEHRHPGIGYMTPASVHTGQAERLYEQRQGVIDQAYLLNPSRFTQRHPTPTSWCHWA